MGVSNEGREIAAFEEETLALRRELQEARASKNLTEIHAAKCVNALARPLTPVTFESPCIMSTPVRTNPINFHRSSSRPGFAKVSLTLLPNDFFTADKNSDEKIISKNSASSTHDINFFRAPMSASSSSSLPSSLASSPSNSLRNYDRDGNAIEIDDEWRWKANNISHQFTERTEERGETEKISSIRSTGRKTDEPMENIYAQILGDSPEAYQELDPNERLIIFAKQNEETKKLRARKIGISNGIGGYRSSDKSSSVSSNDSVPTSSIETPDVVDERAKETSVKSETKYRKRAITEVPDVIVVPNDLCSTRILTSSVLTRATYTTAYI